MIKQFFSDALNCCDYFRDLLIAGDSDTRSPAALTRKFHIPDSKAVSVKSSISKLSATTASSSNTSLNKLSHNRVSATQHQLPGLKAAFGSYTRTRADLRQAPPSQAPRPPPEFAHNRSFELRLRNTETLIAEREKQHQQHQQPKQQRKWVSRKLESRQSSVGSGPGSRAAARVGSELRTRVEQSVAISRLAESNRMAVFRSEPAPLGPAAAASQYVCSDCSSQDMMNTSALRLASGLYCFRYWSTNSISVRVTAAYSPRHSTVNKTVTRPSGSQCPRVLARVSLTSARMPRMFLMAESCSVTRRSSAGTR